MIKSIKHIYTRAGLFRKLFKLNIKESGVDNDGDPYIKLEGGPVLFGENLSSKTDKLLYSLLPKEIKKNIPYECLSTALNIIIRYKEGALMYKGPKKQYGYTVKKGDTVSEMGAYQGYYSINLAEQVGENGKVIAIEPLENNFRLLSKNKIANKLNQLIIVNCGVWNENTTLKFSKRINDAQSSSIDLRYDNDESYEIFVKKLDTIYKEVSVQEIDFMVIQLNGAEINGLEGLTTIKPRNICIAARYSLDERDVKKEIKRLLKDRSYSLDVLEKDFIFAKLNN